MDLKWSTWSERQSSTPMLWVTLSRTPNPEKKKKRNSAESAGSRRELELLQEYQSVA